MWARLDYLRKNVMENKKEFIMESFDITTEPDRETIDFINSFIVCRRYVSSGNLREAYKHAGVLRPARREYKRFGEPDGRN